MARAPRPQWCLAPATPPPAGSLTEGLVSSHVFQSYVIFSKLISLIEG